MDQAGRGTVGDPDIALSPSESPAERAREDLQSGTDQGDNGKLEDNSTRKPLKTGAMFEDTNLIAGTGIEQEKSKTLQENGAV